jgi:type IV pilus assembly protein PilY1
VAADVALIGIADPNVVDHAYAVDTGGNIYRIDFGTSVARWSMNRVAYTNGSGRKFLNAPALVVVPGGRVYLTLGSGDREHPLQSQYPYGSVLNRFYVYRDDLSSTNATNLDDTTVMFDYTAATLCSAAEVLPSASMHGWFMNLNQYGQGEQTVTSAVVVGGLVYFSTNRPIPATQGTCSTVLGEARGYVVNLFNASGAIGVPGSCGGIRTGIFIGGGLPPSPVIATIPVPVIGFDTTVWQTIIIGGMQRSPGGSNGSGGSSVPKCDNWCTQNGTPPIPPTRHQIFWKSSGEN